LPSGSPGGGGVLPLVGYAGRLHLKGLPFFALAVYKRVEKFVMAF